METMESLQNLVEKIRTVKHFQTLSLADLHTIVSAGQVRHFLGRQTIFMEGDPCSGMYVLLHGRVHLCKFGRQGQMNIIAVIEPVIMFNEVAVLDGETNPLTAIATVSEAISRSLNSMKNQGLISTSQTEIVILSVRELADLAQISPVPGEEN